MKLRCSGLDLSEAILKVSKATSQKQTTSPILEGIKISAEGDVLTLTATDLELAIEKKVRAEILIEGEAVIPGKIFTELLKKLTNEEVELSLNDKNQLKVKYAESEGSLQCFNVLEFPNLKKIENAEYFEIKQKNLKNLINKSIISVALDDSRPILKGCLFEVEDKTVTSVALDGYRLAVITESINKSTARLSAVIPSRSLFEISKLLDDSDSLVKVFIQKNFLMCDLKETVILTRLLDGDFINYKKIIPEKQNILATINRNAFENALERASLLSRIDRNNIVKFELKENALIITSESEAGDITEKVPITINEPGLIIAFNAKYLLEVLKNQTDEFINITFQSKIDPCIIKSPIDGEYLYLILPVRLPN